MGKQFMIVRMAAKKMGEALNLTPIPGLFEEPEAEQVLSRLRSDEPETIFLVQEVGTT